MVVAWLLRSRFPVKYAVVQPRPETALSIMVSFAADLDLIGDWIFYTSVMEKQQQSSATTSVLLTFTIISTLTWVLYVTNGRVLYLFNFLFRPRKVNSGLLSLLCVLFEDIPQLVLTFIIEQEFNTISTLNLVTSSYDMIMKIAETWEKRYESVFVRSLRHYEKVDQSTGLLKTAIENGGFGAASEKASDYLSLIIALVEVAKYDDARSQYANMKTFVNEQRRDDLCLLFLNIADCQYYLLEGNYKSGLNRFNVAMNKFDGLHSVDQIRLARFKFHAISCAFQCCLEWGKIDKFKSTKDAHEAFLNTYSNNSVDTRRMLKSWTSLCLVEDPQEALTVFEETVVTLTESDLSEKPNVEYILATSYMVKAIGRVYFWKTENKSLARTHLIHGFRMIQNHYAKHDVRVLNILLEVYMCEVFTERIVESSLLQDYIEECLKNHDIIPQIERLIVKYHVLTAIRLQKTLWTCAPSSNQYVNNEISNHMKKAKERWESLQESKKRSKYIFNAELCYFFAVLFQLKGDEKSCAEWINQAKKEMDDKQPDPLVNDAIETLNQTGVGKRGNVHVQMFDAVV